MKKLFSTFLVLAIVKFASAQITLEETYEDLKGLSIIKLENSGEKYLQYDMSNGIVKLYNLDHSLFKTITLPTTMEPLSKDISISHVSENLFNSDNLVEILCFKRSWYEGDDPITEGSVVVINENGEEVFTQNSMVVVEQRSTTYYGYDDSSSFIYNTSEGTKMILYSYEPTDIGFKVFSLPGSVALSVSDVNNNSIVQSLAYPNPSNSKIAITYDLASSSKGVITIYDSNGRVIENKNIDKTFDDVFIDVSGYGSGLYVYIITDEKQIISNGKFLVN